MTDEEKLTIEFFKNGSARRVLKRFIFNEEEKKLVEDAIRTAQRANPRMKLVYEADELLKKVAKTRTPIASDTKTSRIEEAKISFVSEQIEAERRREYRPTPFYLSPAFIVPMTGLVITAILNHYMHTRDDPEKLYTYEGAKEYCSKKNAVLPLWITDLPATRHPLRSYKGFWTADGKIIYDQEYVVATGIEKADPKIGEKYYAVCVEENNISGAFLERVGY